MSEAFGAFWIRIEAEASAAESTIARAKAQLDQLGQRVQDTDLLVTRSVSSAVSGLNALARTSFALFDIMGVAVDETLEAGVVLLLGYAQQLALIATSSSVVNPIYAGALATLAVTVQAKALQLRVQGKQEAEAHLQKAQRLMDQVTQSLIIFTRSG